MKEALRAVQGRNQKDKAENVFVVVSECETSVSKCACKRYRTKGTQSIFCWSNWASKFLNMKLRVLWKNV